MGKIFVVLPYALVNKETPLHKKRFGGAPRAKNADSDGSVFSGRYCPFSLGLLFYESDNTNLFFEKKKKFKLNFSFSQC